MAIFTYIFGSFRKSLFFLGLLILLLLKNNLFATGSLITSRNYYFFQEPKFNSKRYYTPRYQIFNVLDLKKSKDGNYFFLVQANVIKEKKSETGFVYVSSVTSKNQIVQLFPEIPEKEKSILDYYKIPFSELKFTKEQVIAKKFSFQTWHKVEYNFDLPEQVWAAESAVIYRFDQPAQWLSAKFQELLTEKIPRDKRNRILSGNIQKKCSKKEVLLTLGLPIEEIEKGELTELKYKDRIIILEKNEVTQIIINKE